METRDDLIRKFRRLACMLFVIYLLCPLAAKDGIILPMGILSVMAIVLFFVQIVFFMNGHEGLLEEFGTDDFGQMVFVFIYGIVAVLVPLYVIYKSKSSKTENFQRLSYIMLLPLLFFSAPFCFLFSNTHGMLTGIIIVFYHIVSYLLLSRQGKRIDDFNGTTSDATKTSEEQNNIIEHISNQTRVPDTSPIEDTIIEPKENVYSSSYEDDNQSWYNKGISLKYLLILVGVVGIAIGAYYVFSVRNAQTTINLSANNVSTDTAVTVSVSENPSDQDNISDVNYEECGKQLVQEILDGTADIFDEGWVNRNCTPKMKQRLIDEYDFDLEPGQKAYASWILVGSDDMREIDTELSELTYDGQFFYGKLKCSFKSEFLGYRTLRYKILYDDNNHPRIDDVEKKQDFE